MAKVKPRITVKQIRDAATEKSFQRGEDYQSQGAIHNATRQDFRLWAECSGSDLYETSVTLNKDGIQSSSCTCPYDWGGLCKHQVALLLTYVEDGDRVRVIPPLAELLKSRSREELVKLIGQMLEQSPNLIDLMEVSVVSQDNQAIDLSSYRRQAKRAFQLEKMRAMVAALKPIMVAAHTLVESGHWHDGGNLYQLLLEESIDAYDDEVSQVDYDGEVGCVIQDMAAGLSSCLEEAVEDEEETRTFWLTTLLNAVFKDIALGGMDFAAGAWDGLVESANEEDWEWIEAMIRQKIQEFRGSSWAQESLVDLLGDRPQRANDERSSQALIEELGTPSQKIFLWAEQGKWAESIELAKVKFINAPGLVFQLADALLAAGAGVMALEYVLAVQDQVSEWKYEEWLAAYYVEMGDTGAGLEWALKVFRRSPSLARYQKLKALSPKKNEWKVLRAQMFELLESRSLFGVWVDILLSEEDLDRAIEVLGRVKQERVSQIFQVAQVVAQKNPTAAIGLYQMLVTELILNKSRSSYQQAIPHLKVMKSLYEGMEKRSDWDSYIIKLSNTYPTLRALQEELKKAKLL